jgi:hypothetical protein
MASIEMTANERPPLAAICEPRRQNLTVLAEMRRVKKKMPRLRAAAGA